jgi:hypothetical protein
VTRRDHRAVLAGVAVLAAAAAIRLVPSAIHAVLELREDVAVRRGVLGRMRADLSQAGSMVDSGETVRQRLIDLAPRLLTGGTQAEAISDLTTRLSSLAGRHQAGFDRADPIPDSAYVGSLRRVTVRAGFDGDLRGALTFLDAVVGSPAVLTVHEVRIVASDPASDDARPEILKGEFVVSGWYLQHATHDK